MVGGVRGNASGGNGFTYIEADLNGRFRFAHLRPGNYDVHAVPAVASLLRVGNNQCTYPDTNRSKDHGSGRLREKRWSN